MTAPPVAVRFGSASARPGEKSWGRLRVRESGNQATLGVCIIHGQRPGRHVVLQANQHGVEVNGVEAIRQFCEGADPRKVRGTIFAIPSCNPRAAMRNEQAWIEDPSRVRLDTPEAAYRNPYNMNFNWPGRKGDSLVARTCYEIWHRAVLAPHRAASFVLDIHCHQRETAVYADTHAAADLGVVAGIRNVVITGGSGTLDTSTSVCTLNGVMGMCVELCGQQAIVPESVREGVRAIRNLMTFLGVLRGHLDLPEEAVFFDPWRSDRPAEMYSGTSFVDGLAGKGGLVVPRKGPYETVRKGDVVCDILDPRTGQIVEHCPAPMAGGLYMMRSSPAACRRGERLFTVSLAKRVRPTEYVGRLDPASYVDPDFVRASRDFIRS